MRYEMLLLGLGAVLTGFSGRVTNNPEITVATPLLAPAVPVTASSTPAPARGAARARHALNTLRAHVVKQSDEAALRSAITAYFNFKASHPEKIKKPYLYYIDYGLSSRAPRGYVFNMETLELVDGPFIVAHGRGSGPRNGVPTKFSNRHGSAATSLGLYVTQETYGFSGKASGSYYRSIGLRMAGQSGRFNGNARARGVVVHGAPYVSSSQSGRSEGCPAMEQFRARRLLPLIANGSVVFQYSPRDADWERNDPWVNAD